ncbi:hypothetical protein CY652_08680 [Burkholderia sp. WAC0059]|uniref:hypothetical protein n=1 Tax=Burkholderia sp. WAC0059 TaxID=2066022 RepID=UPI000C7F52CC|nr:hypothetical protein [Burkholderia sp. WAC0059]PLZ02977.1 hypothetical protein CY652_08680 [Burkholderia sp. WAC0059]
MDAGNAEKRGNARCRVERFFLRRPAGALPLRAGRVAVLLALLMGGLHDGVAGAQVQAQDGSLFDSRVTQQSVADTICRPGYADTVSPPFDEIMAYKDRLLAARGIDASDGPSYALDRRVPIVLGGSPDAPDNFDLLPWAGHGGERRKALLTVRLKRCVCSGSISLADAQAAIMGDWVGEYARFTRLACAADDDETTDAEDKASSGS